LLFGFSRTLDLGQVFYWMNWISQDKFRFSGSVPGSLVFRMLVLFGLLKDTSIGFYRIWFFGFWFFFGRLDQSLDVWFFFTG